MQAMGASAELGYPVTVTAVAPVARCAAKGFPPPTASSTSLPSRVPRTANAMSLSSSRPSVHPSGRKTPSTSQNPYGALPSR